MTPVFEVLHPGVLATLQDLGRPRGQAFGFAAAGAMDVFALQTANLLAGNARDAVALEAALGGLALRALEDRVVALCGAGGSWKSERIRKGGVLEIPSTSSGVWAYLAVEGGFAAETFLDSGSTDLRARRGGFRGRALAAGDVLPAGPPSARARDGRGLIRSEVPAHPAEVVARVMPGPQAERIDLDAFFGADYAVTARSDRMGYHLRGPAALACRGGSDILSEAVAFGSIQLPPDGRPIVLMADRQATGGYAQIAAVITADHGKVAQARPGGRLRFRPVSIEEAQGAAARLERLLGTVEEGTK